MALKFPCPICHRELTVRDDMAGKKGRCPSCQAKVDVPDSASPPNLPVWDKEDEDKVHLKPPPTPARAPLHDEGDYEDKPPHTRREAMLPTGNVEAWQKTNSGLFVALLGNWFTVAAFGLFFFLMLTNLPGGESSSGRPPKKPDGISFMAVTAMIMSLMGVAGVVTSVGGYAGTLHAPGRHGVTSLTVIALLLGVLETMRLLNLFDILVILGLKIRTQGSRDIDEQLPVMAEMIFLLEVARCAVFAFCLRGMELSMGNRSRALQPFLLGIIFPSVAVLLILVSAIVSPEKGDGVTTVALLFVRILSYTGLLVWFGLILMTTRKSIRRVARRA